MLLKKTSLAIAITLSLATLGSTVPVPTSSGVEKSIGQQQKVISQKLNQAAIASQLKPQVCTPVPYWPYCQ